MLKRAKPILLFTLVFAAVAMLGTIPALADKPQCQEVQIMGPIKFVWAPGCPDGSGQVFIFDTSLNCPSSCTLPTGPTDPACNSCWRLGVEVELLICTCEGSGCVSDLNTNIANQSSPNVTVVCDTTPVIDTGPSLGAALFFNPPRGCIGERCFR
jgi:hypothetical protein